MKQKLMMTTNKRPLDDGFTMPSTDFDLRREFLAYLDQTDTCELFYSYMKSEHLAYVLEFYLACDGLKNFSDDQKNPTIIIKLIYKHYLSNGRFLSSSNKFFFPTHLISSIKQRLNKQDFHLQFYNQAQEYVLQYMLQMCYPKYLIEQQNLPPSKRRAPTFTPMHRRSISLRKKDVFGKLKQQSNLDSIEESTLNHSRQARMIQLKKQEYNLAQRNPAAFFAAIKTRLLVYQSGLPDYVRMPMIDEDSLAILDRQIAQTIDDDDDDDQYCTFEHSIPDRRHDSGVTTDSSERNAEISSSPKLHPSIDVIWYPSLDSPNALLSTIPHLDHRLTFGEFRQVFKKQSSFRYFFKTVCTPDINREKYIFRELTIDEELVPFYHGKIFVQLDRID